MSSSRVGSRQRIVNPLEKSRQWFESILFSFLILSKEIKMLAELKRKLVNSIKNNDVPKRDILRLVVGEIELAPKAMTNDQIISVIRKNIKNNEESQKFLDKNTDSYSKLAAQTEVLESFLPGTLTLEEIESQLLSSEGPEFEQIRDAKSEGQAIGIAMKFFKVAGLSQNVLGDDIRVVVKKIRQ
jgi:uncharacterized protein YqeY